MAINQLESVSITLKNINLSYGDTQVINDVSLEIKKGEFFSFLGPSGCGKSTLLRLIAGFEECQSGEVLLGDQEVSSLPPWKREVGMVFQNYALWPHMTIFENVAFGLEERKTPKNEIKGLVMEALELVDLQDYVQRRPNQLSGGQQQRVALARTIVVKPKILLLDEPLSNLDAKLRVHMRQELLALQRKLSLTTIFVTHDQEEANTTSDRIAILKGGVVQQVGAPRELYNKPNNLFVANFLGTANIIDGNIKAHGTELLFENGEGLKISLKNTLNSGSGSIMFRPQNVKLIDQNDAACDLVGDVINCEFLGHIIRYEVKVFNQNVIIDELYNQGDKPAEIGDTVGMSLNKDNIIFI